MTPRLPAGAWRQLAPASAFYLVFFGIPLVILLVLSTWRQEGFSQVPDLTLAGYVDALTNKLYVTVLLRTVVVGLVTAIIVVPIAYALAFLWTGWLFGRTAAAPLRDLALRRSLRFSLPANWLQRASGLRELHGTGPLALPPSLVPPGSGGGWLTGSRKPGRCGSPLSPVGPAVASGSPASAGS